MATEPQAGTVSTAQAMALLLMEHPDELKKLQKGGFIKPIGPDSWRLVELVQGFARAARKPHAAAPVSAEKLALHLDCVRSYVGKLVEQGVIAKRSDGRFDLDQCRTKYLAHLRAERKLSPKSAADAEFTAAKAELIRYRLLEKKRDLIPREDAAADMERMIGLFLTGLSNLPGRCAGRDLGVRRAFEKAVYELRTELAGAVTKWADEVGEPPLEDAA